MSKIIKYCYGFTVIVLFISAMMVGMVSGTKSDSQPIKTVKLPDATLTYSTNSDESEQYRLCRALLIASPFAVFLGYMLYITIKHDPGLGGEIC